MNVKVSDAELMAEGLHPKDVMWLEAEVKNWQAQCGFERDCKREYAQRIAQLEAALGDRALALRAIGACVSTCPDCKELARVALTTRELGGD